MCRVPTPPKNFPPSRKLPLLICNGITNTLQFHLWRFTHKHTADFVDGVVDFPSKMRAQSQRINHKLMRCECRTVSAEKNSKLTVCHFQEKLANGGKVANGEGWRGGGDFPYSCKCVALPNYIQFITFHLAESIQKATLSVSSDISFYFCISHFGLSLGFRFSWVQFSFYSCHCCRIQILAKLVARHLMGFATKGPQTSFVPSQYAVVPMCLALSAQFVAKSNCRYVHI